MPVEFAKDLAVKLANPARLSLQRWQALHALLARQFCHHTS